MNPHFECSTVLLIWCKEYFSAIKFKTLTLLHINYWTFLNRYRLSASWCTGVINFQKWSTFWSTLNICLITSTFSLYSFLCRSSSFSADHVKDWKLSKTAELIHSECYATRRPIFSSPTDGQCSGDIPVTLSRPLPILLRFSAGQYPVWDTDRHRLRTIHCRP